MKPEKGCAWCAKDPLFRVDYHDPVMGNNSWYFCTDNVDSICLRISIPRLRCLTQDHNFWPQFILLKDEKGESS